LGKCESLIRYYWWLPQGSLSLTLVTMSYPWLYMVSALFSPFTSSPTVISVTFICFHPIVLFYSFSLSCSPVCQLYNDAEHLKMRMKRQSLYLANQVYSTGCYWHDLWFLFRYSIHFINSIWQSGRISLNLTDYFITMKNTIFISSGKRSFQQIVLDSNMQTNETGPLFYTIHKNKFKID